MARADSEDDLLLDRWSYYYAAAGTEISYPSLDRCIFARYPSKKGASHERRLRDLGKRSGGLPRPKLGFQIGQCLRPSLWWSSGPIALWASGQTFAFAGFFASLLSLRPPTPNDLQRISQIRRAFIPTVFDAAPFLDDTFMTAYAEMNPDELDYFRRSMRPLVPEEDEIIEKHRQQAWQVWEVTESELTEFDEAWTHWNAIRHSSVATLEFNHAFRAALSVAKSGVLTQSEREKFAASHLADGVALLGQWPQEPSRRRPIIDDSLQARLTRYSRTFLERFKPKRNSRE